MRLITSNGDNSCLNALQDISSIVHEKTKNRKRNLDLICHNNAASNFTHDRYHTICIIFELILHVNAISDKMNVTIFP